MIRTIGVSVAIVCTAFAVAACGGGGDGDSSGASGDGARARDRVDVFNAAASEISADAMAVFLRTDAKTVRQVDDVLRSVAIGRVLEDELPPRTELTDEALRALGFEARDATALAPIARGDIALARDGTEWTMWFAPSRRAMSAARAYAESNPTTSRLEDGVLAVSTTTLADVVAVDADSLAQDETWRAAAKQREAKRVFAIGHQAGTTIAASTDDDGIRVAGRSGEVDCRDDAGDALKELARAPATSDIVAAQADLNSGARPLDAPVAVLRRMTALAAQLDVGDGRLGRIVDAYATGTAANIAVPRDGTKSATAVSVTGVGTKRPRVGSPSSISSDQLAASSAFVAVRDAADAPRSARMWWVDVARIVQNVADTYLDGLEAGAARGIASGIDGVLAWQTCGGRVGARIAIPGS